MGHATISQHILQLVLGNFCAVSHRDRASDDLHWRLQGWGSQSRKKASRCSEGSQLMVL